MTTADAWVLHPRRSGEDRPTTLVRATIEIGSPAADEALVAPLYGCWEGNMGHALDRRPIDVCVHRSEDAVVLGNAAVVRVIEVGRDVHEVEPGQLAMLHSAAEVDERGYMIKALGYDGKGQMGCLATHMRLKGRQLIALPESGRHTPAQWAAFGVRYTTAWANWRIAENVARLFHDPASQPALEVWGWGGGTTLAELDLAARHGHHAVMLSGTDENLAMIEKCGIAAIDRRMIGDLVYDREAGREGIGAYRRALRALDAEVQERTGGSGVHVFVDMIGAPVWRATLRTLAREAVVATAGWKHGMRLEFMRAEACIDHHQFVHTHFARRVDAEAAMAYADANDWVPAEPERVYSFDEIPELVEDYRAGTAGYFPRFSINEP